uniref:Uncharacterized protein n=1 Tax=Oryza glumipatula TaxID=40148 RepID=A0A0E0AGM7_9ORYZ
MDVAKDVFPPLVDAKAVPSRISDDVRIWQEGQERQRVTLSKVWKKFRDIVWDGNSEMNMSVNFWQVRPAEKVDISPSTPPKRLKNCEIDTAATSVSVDNADEQVPTTRQRLEALFPDNI